MKRIKAFGRKGGQLFWVAFFLVTIFSFGAAAQTVTNTPVHQLRIYEVPKENEQVFHERFRDHARRIMKRYGFHILAMWRSHSADRTEFVYLLKWKSRKEMEASWAKFMADKEWIEIKKKSSAIHGIFVNNIEDRVLELTDYSPRIGAPHNPPK